MEVHGFVDYRPMHFDTQVKIYRHTSRRACNIDDWGHARTLQESITMAKDTQLRRSLLHKHTVSRSEKSAHSCTHPWLTHAGMLGPPLGGSLDARGKFAGAASRLAGGPLLEAFELPRCSPTYTPPSRGTSERGHVRFSTYIIMATHTRSSANGKVCRSVQD